MCKKTNNKTPYKQKPRTRQLQWHILPNRKALMLIIFSNYFKKLRKREHSLNLLYEATITPIPKLDKDITIKENYNIFDEYRCNILQPNISKSKMQQYIKRVTQHDQVGFHSMVTRMVQHVQFNQCNTSH